MHGLMANLFCLTAKSDALTSNGLGHKISVVRNRFPEIRMFKKGNPLKFARTENPAVFLEFTVAVALVARVYRSKRQQAFGNIGKFQGWMRIFELFKNLKLIAANHLYRRFRKAVALRPQHMPA